MIEKADLEGLKQLNTAKNNLLSARKQIEERLALVDTALKYAKEALKYKYNLQDGDEIDLNTGEIKKAEV